MEPSPITILASVRRGYAGKIPKGSVYNSPFPGDRQLFLCKFSLIEACSFLTKVDSAAVMFRLVTIGDYLSPNALFPRRLRQTVPSEPLGPS
jgi:hypothetical protein